MTKMTGIILMVIGAILLVIGIVVYTTSKAQRIEPAINQAMVNKEVQVITDTVLVEKEVIREVVKEEKSLDTDLNNVIAMAIADGVLTKNERETIRKIAKEKSLDYESIILDVEQKLKHNNIEAETEVIDQLKKKGNDFEKYVVEKFSKKYFKLKEWAGDKYVNGTYAETTLHPDLVLVFTLKGESRTFAVECKWRKSLYNGGIEFANTDQLARYKKFEKQQNIPVYIAVGTGGEASNPKYLSVIPVAEIETPFLSLDVLKKHNRNTEQNFFYDMESGKLD
jgi:hypothetical protein